MKDKLFNIANELFVGCTVIITVSMLALGLSGFIGSLYSFIFELNAIQEIAAGFVTICFVLISWLVGHKVLKQ